MSEPEVLPEVKQIVGAMLFASRQPLTPRQLRQVFPRAAETFGGITDQYAEVKESDIRTALGVLREEFEGTKLGFRLVEVAGGFRLQNDKVCGPWLRELLDKGKPSRLSRPALETLSIIAYRQPCTRQEIESVRGVSVDAIVRNLLEMQLIKVAGRSELPGRPWLFGTTQAFLEHFGLNSLDDLPGMEELKRNASKLAEDLEKREAENEGSVEPEPDTPAVKEGEDPPELPGLETEDEQHV